MARLLIPFLVLLALAAPARADDISAAGRGVVRVVVIAFEDGEVVDFTHGSGFAVAPNRIVTNAHVVASAAEYPKDIAVGVVPSEGNRAFPGRLVAFDPARDLALIELREGSIPLIPLYTGPLADGASVAALGYPGNVDLATARSAEDYIRPLPPARSAGIFSNLRPINGIATLLHTANIGRGHSGGPLLDQCGRVLGVNTLTTRNEAGDSPFAFAVANRELMTFLREARQPFQSVASECVPMAERLREDQERVAAEARARQAEAAERARSERARALAAIEDRRETRLAAAALLLVFSLLAFGGAGILIVKERQRPAIGLAAAGAALLVAAVIVFFTRPSLADAGTVPAEQASVADPARFAGPKLCTLVAERSRVTVSSTDPVPLEWSATGCVNGRTQYAQAGETWTRLLVPDAEQAVARLEFRPATGEYVVTRYLLDGATMARARALRREVDVKACTADAGARAILADQQRDIADLLPELPNERLVYSCRPRPADDGQ